MKTYMHYRVGLFISLLMFNTLASCARYANTRQWFPSFSFHNVRYEVRRAVGNVKRSYTFNPKKTICLVVSGGAVLTTSILAAVCGIYHLANPSNKLDPDIHNGTNVTTSSPFTSTESSTGSYTSLPTQQAENITKAIEEGEKKWGTDETVSQEPTTTLTTLSTTSTTSAATTTQLADDGVTVANPMVLDDQVMSDLKAHDFSKERIEYWLGKDLSVNAKDNNGNTLLYKAASQPNEATVRWLVQKKDIDLSVKGYTDILQWAVANGYSGIVSIILEAGLGNQNSKDADNNNLWHLAVKGSFKNVLKVLKNIISHALLSEKNNDGKTPVEVAQENGDQVAVDILKKLLKESDK